MTISLTGFMGSGKSSVGKELSTLLSLPVVDLDTFIENSAGRTIPEIFTTDGEPAFRTMELSALRRLLLPLSRSMCTQPAINVADNTATDALSGTPGSTSMSHTPAALPDIPSISQSAAIPDGPADFILSLGGGTLTTPGCVELIREKTFCIYLRAGIDTLVENLRDDISGRPMLSSVRTASPIRTEAHGTPHADSSPLFHGAEPCPPESSSRSVQDGTDRPLRDRIESLMSCRSRVYESTARLTVDIDGKSYPAIASEIVSRL